LLFSLADPASAEANVALEIITLGPDESAAPPLLFVHGATANAALWARNFMPWFADRGFRTHAVSLRGHGKSGGSLANAGLDDYLTDLRAAAARLPAAPVLIGHSMGGYLVQHLLASGFASPAAVLMAPGPSRGMWLDSMRLMALRPAAFARMNWTRDVREMYSGEGLRHLLFAPGVPADLIDEAAAAIGPESWTALTEMNHCLPNCAAARGRTPVLVLAGMEDQIFSTYSSRQTALDWAGEACFFAGRGHMLFIEPGWEDVAEKLHHWLIGHLGAMS
jgi:pimeloyl-ACP methyl ester carboxylesterase